MMIINWWATWEITSQGRGTAEDRPCSRKCESIQVFIKAAKDLPPLPVAGEDPGPVVEPPDEGGGEEHEADGHDPVGPNHNQSRLKNLLTVHREMANRYMCENVLLDLER